MKTIKIGQKVYYPSTNSDINAGIVRAINLGEKADSVEVIGTENTYGSYVVKIGDCYQTKKELLTAMKESHDKQVKEYCDSIRTVEDLVRFCYGHNMCAEEYTDYEAKEAANIKAAKLLGITLDESMPTKDDDFVDAVDTLET